MKMHQNVMMASAEQSARSFVSTAMPPPASRETHSVLAGHGPATSVKTFVQNVFIPRFVDLKSKAGRQHYYSILKYILTPESVEQLFATHRTQHRRRLRSEDDWPYLDNVSLCDVTPDRVSQLIACASFKGYSPQTLKHIRNVVGTIIKYAVRERIFHGDNPIGAVRLPTMTRRECHYLTMAQAKTILKVMKYPEREVALLSICTGLGVTEICALRWRHVNLAHVAVYEDGRRIPARSIIVGKSSRYDSFRPVQPTPDKYIAISDTLADALMELRQLHRSDNPNDFLLKAPKGDSRSPLTVELLQLKSISKELQIPWLSWQVLKRAHKAFLEELRIALTDELVASAFLQLSSRNRSTCLPS